MDAKGIPNLAIIPARGGSKRIANKNVAVLRGAPLISHTIRAAKNASMIHHVVVSTDDAEVAGIATAMGVHTIYPRPAELATDEASTVDVLRHAVRVAEESMGRVETAVLLQPTSPFRNHDHIDSAIKLFASSAADTVTSVCIARQHPFYAWKPAGECIAPLFDFDAMNMQRTRLPVFYVENGSIFVVRRSVLFSHGIYGLRVVPFLMGTKESTDIDEASDLLWARYLAEAEPSLLS